MFKKKKYVPSKEVITSLDDLILMDEHASSFHKISQKRKVSHILAGKHASKMRGRGLDFSEVRKYVAGDDIRNIDWKVTARTKVTHSKVFTEEKEKPTFIIVDQSLPMFFGTKKYTKSVIAAKLAAIIAYWSFKQGDRIGGLVFGNQKPDLIAPKRNHKNILQLFGKIVEQSKKNINAEDTDFDQRLSETIKKVSSVISHDFFVVIISDFNRYNPKTIEYISKIALHNDILLAHISDPFERKVPASKFVVGNRSKQLILDGRKTKIKDRYNKLFQDNFMQFQQKMDGYGVPILEFNTVENIEDQIISKFF